MGARERAKGRSVKKSSGKGSPWSANPSKASQNGNHRAVQEWQSFASSPYSSSPQNGFSMAQEARNTERHGLSWTNTQLRKNAIAFVSAGNLVREEPQSSRSESSRMEDSEGKLPEGSLPVDPPTPALPAAEATGQVQEISHVPQATRASIEAPLSRDQGYSSASDSDEVVFQGRNTSKNPPNRFSVAAAEPSPPVHQQTSASIKPLTAPSGEKVQSVSAFEALIGSRDTDPTPPKPRRRWESRYDQRRRQKEEEEEEALMRDYIDNMAIDDEEDEEDDAIPNESAKNLRHNEHFRYHKDSGEQHTKVQLVSVQKTEKIIGRDESDEWDSGDLDDLHVLSTTDEDVPEVRRVLRHRERDHGKQYLVTGPGMEAGDAKWVSSSLLVSTTAIEQIQAYEAVLQARLQDSVGESSDEDEGLDDLLDEIDSERDENERILERTSRMTDEQIARALAKQEELGMGGDELLLFAGEDADGLDGEDVNLDEFMNGDSFIPFSMSKHTSNRGRSKRNRRGRDVFPSAGALADALDQDPYGGFDVMDFDRPSLRPKHKGRKSDFPYDLEDVDEDLAVQLMQTWTKDREKKATRKREKMESERALLIDSAEGSDPTVIKARIRQFLISEADTLEMTPMDAPLRASVHRLAKSLQMTSKSHGKDGKGLGRYPVLTKTPYTPEYTIDTIWQADSLMSLRKFFPKHLHKGYGPTRSGVPVPRRHDRGGVSAASYANGDVVGATAPEIGQDNRGRAMLEKMGWSAGMGIGKEGNKGSIDAVKHVVKTNKAGLG